MEQVARWFDEWTVALRTIPPFDDECAGYEEAKKSLVVENLRRDQERLLRIVQRGQAPVVQKQERPRRQAVTTEGLIAALQRDCDHDGPGDLRELGPRHDNDHASIENIRVPPTHAELISEDDPYLPGNFFEAPHFYEPQSVERLFDVQFRLLREELTCV